MYEWLPMVSRFFPGAITPHPRGFPGSVYDVTLDWWCVFVAHTRVILDAKEK